MPFNDYFSESSLRQIYASKITYSKSVGIDRVKAENFGKNISENLDIISRKIRNDDYSFTPYKEVLISKGKGKTPRVISIPTVRDRIVIAVICNYLTSFFSTTIGHRIPHLIVDEIHTEISRCNYSHYLKFDLVDFYGSINHSILVSRLHKYKVPGDWIQLILKAVQTPTVSAYSKASDRKSNIHGVPQGLGISNILSSIYMLPFDFQMKKRKTILYNRYVDDILILASKQNRTSVKQSVIDKLTDTSQFALTINEEKTEFGLTTKKLVYLGYVFDNTKISVRPSSIEKTERSLENLFLDYQRNRFKNIDHFIWVLNLRITGAIQDSSKYGWVFYFSQLNDTKILYHLDWLVARLITRFKMDPFDFENKLKSYVRTFYEIRYNLRNTKYIPNFNEYTTEEMRDILVSIFGLSINDLVQDDIVIYEFNRIINQQVEDLEEDIQNIS